MHFAQGDKPDDDSGDQLTSILADNDQYFGYKSKERRKGKLLSWNDVRAFKKSQKLDRKIKC